MIVFHVSKTGQTMLRIDINFPGKIGRGTVKFLVEEVAPASDCLTQRHAGGNNIRPLRKIKFAPASVKVQNDEATNHGARNPQPTFPNGERIQRMCKIPTRG